MLNTWERYSCKLEGNVQLDYGQKDIRGCTAFSWFRTGTSNGLL